MVLNRVEDTAVLRADLLHKMPNRDRLPSRQRTSHFTPSVPPFYRPRLFARRVESHAVFKIVTKPTKLRFDTFCLPVRDMSASSCVMLPPAATEKRSLDKLARSVVIIAAAAVSFRLDMFSVSSLVRI